MPAIVVDSVTFNFEDVRLYRHMADAIQIILHEGGSFVMAGSEATTSILVNAYRSVKFIDSDDPEFELNDEWVRSMVLVLRHVHKTSLLPNEEAAKATIKSIEETVEEVASESPSDKPAPAPSPRTVTGPSIDEIGPRF